MVPRSEMQQTAWSHTQHTYGRASRKTVCHRWRRTENTMKYKIKYNQGTDYSDLHAMLWLWRKASLVCLRMLFSWSTWSRYSSTFCSTPDLGNVFPPPVAEKRLWSCWILSLILRRYFFSILLWEVFRTDLPFVCTGKKWIYQYILPV